MSQRELRDKLGDALRKARHQCVALSARLGEEPSAEAITSIDGAFALLGDDRWWNGETGKSQED